MRMEYECNSCGKKFSSEESLNQHSSMSHPIVEKKAKVSLKKYFVFAIILLIIIVSIFLVRGYMKSPGKFDDFAKCLGEKGVVYGNDYCSYTVTQLGYFGKSQKHLNYVKCIDNEALCDEKGVEKTPTWEINGDMYSGVQDFERLSAVSGCVV